MYKLNDNIKIKNKLKRNIEILSLMIRNKY